MFTGLITEVGTVESLVDETAGLGIRVRAPATARGLAVGGSVAVSGVCLTAVGVTKRGFSAQVIPETCRRSTLGGVRPGDRVNLERPLSASGELGGHFVQGHVDGVARIVDWKRQGKEALLAVELPGSLRGLVVEKGSIAIDGVSLTVAWVRRRRFGVALIPHTLAATTLGGLALGARVNLEADILAKYVAAMIDKG